MEPFYDGPKITKTTTGDLLGGTEHDNENAGGSHIPSGEARQKPSQVEEFPLRNSAHGVKCGVFARLRKTIQ